MKFYKENNINPVGGCLPLLVQMPLIIAAVAWIATLLLGRVMAMHKDGHED